jgi:hypothetical protein
MIFPVLVLTIDFNFVWSLLQFCCFTSPRSCTVCTKTCQKEAETICTGPVHCCHQETGMLRMCPILTTIQSKQRPQLGEICNPSNKHMRHRYREYLILQHNCCRDQYLESHVPRPNSQPRNYHCFTFIYVECSFANNKSVVWNLCVYIHILTCARGSLSNT